MQKAVLSDTLKFLCFILIFALLAGLFSAWALRAEQDAALDVEMDAPPAFTVVIDAGHGGEDGGASSADGALEKELNLAVALYLQGFLEANGVPVVMTRTDDRLLYDRNVNYIGRKKQLDLAAREQIGRETPNSIFVSIHMNAYPLSQYSGLQVWYSPNHAHSKLLAQHIQQGVCATLQPDNHRTVKAATSSIYLLHRLESPAVLVECGFLSNPEEAARLATPDYQQALAFRIFLSIMEAQTT